MSSKFGDGIDWSIHVKEIYEEHKGNTNEIFYKHDSNDLVFKTVKKYVNTSVLPKLLDAGCHICRWIKYWEDGGFTYTGVDQSKEAIEFVKRYFPEGVKNRRYHNKFLWDIDFKEEFDVVTSISVLQHNRKHEKQLILTKIYKALKPGGVLFIMESPVPEQTKTQLTPQGWINLVEKFGFKFLESWHPSGEFSLDDCYIFRKLANVNPIPDKLTQDEELEIFIDDMYWQVLEREADESGKNLYLELLKNGKMSRHQLPIRLKGSEEYHHLQVKKFKEEGLRG